MAKSNLKENRLESLIGSRGGVPHGEKEENTNGFKGLLIKRITMKENRALISLSDDDDFKTQNGDFNVKDEVTEEFKTLWDSAKTIIIALNPQLSKEISALRLNNIQFFYDSKGFLKDVSFSVSWTIDDNGHILNLNYQKFPIYKPEMSETTVAISGKHVDLLHDIIKKAKDYMNGETRTKQMKLIVNNSK